MIAITLSAAILAFFSSYAAAQQMVYPRCELCGCEFCEPGNFPVGNPSGVIPIPEQFLDQAPPGFTEIPCSLLDFAGQSGQIPPDLCNDELRLLDEFRNICGCPPLPVLPSSSPVTAPVAAPTTTAPTASPVKVSQPSPPTFNDTCEICGCADCAPGQFPMGNPSGTIPIPPELQDQAPPGFTEIPCSLLDTAGQTGQIPNDLCTDELRLLPNFREICGCPPLPSAATVAPSSAPSMAPSSSPFVATMMPVLSPTSTKTPSAPTITASPTRSPASPAPVSQAPQVRPSVDNDDDDDDDDADAKISGEGYKLDCEANKFAKSERSERGKGKGKGKKGGEKSCKGMKKKGGKGGRGGKKEKKSGKGRSGGKQEKKSGKGGKY